nr:IS630 family transposase [Anoxybacillus sp.]
MLGRYQVLRAIWSEVGKQVPAYGHRAQVSVFGAVNVHNDETVLHRAPSAAAMTFLDFLRILANRYQEKFIALVLDNARVHHAKMVKAYLSQEGHVFHFTFLPPYSSQLNPIERLWKWLKDTVIANVFHKDQNDIDHVITRFADYISKH